MRKVSKVRALTIAVLALACGISQGAPEDGTIVIDRAADNRTITVRYENISAALVEMRVNGESIASRSVDSRQVSGETNFALNPAILVGGENMIEVLLYDASGKLVGHKSTTVIVNRRARGPVFLQGPQPGATVMGSVRIEIGFQREMRKPYVSFFVDDDFQSLRNFPPYTYMWDTTRLSNGWHEIQAWIVDEGNRTYRTERMRLFVNNPRGRTVLKGSLKPTTNPDSSATGAKSGLKPTKTVTGAASGLRSATPPATSPTVSANVETVTTAPRVGTKAPKLGKGTITGQRAMLPTGTRLALADVVPPETVTVEPKRPAKLPLTEIKLGTRLSGPTELEITLNGRKVKFDVMPRIENGVPLTPFRHLFEQAGGMVLWTHESKTVEAKGLGQHILFRIGDPYGLLDGARFRFEVTPFIDSGRSVVPLSFVSSTLEMDVQYDPNTGHVLITKASKT
ncbi:MAG: hypothetical protein IH945_13765 [Armatimonadetes bacterium]|nr:hypothetical protein [Armatimonadota bacterium]